MKNHNKILWITETAVMLALLVTLQWVTAPTQTFAGQYITGSCVNAVLAITVLVLGLWSGMIVAVLSPFFAFLLNIGPKFVQIVPCISLGNLVFVVMLYFLVKYSRPLWIWVLGLVAAAAAKALFLYGAVNLLVVPLMGSALPPKVAETFKIMFSWSQMFTALIGGSLALVIWPLLKKALKR